MMIKVENAINGHLQASNCTRIYLLTLIPAHRLVESDTIQMRLLRDHIFRFMFAFSVKGKAENYSHKKSLLYAMINGQKISK